jgi:hypothetical protein
MVASQSPLPHEVPETQDHPQMGSSDLTHSRSSAQLLWIGLALFVILTIAFLLPVYPNDYWWYLRLGKDILTIKRIPRIDTYTFTQAGMPVVYQSWLSAVLFWVLYKSGGLTLTVLARGLSVGIFYSFIWLGCRGAGAGPILSTLLILVAALAGSNNWVVRPQVFAYPLFGCALWLLTRRGEPEKLLWLLMPITILWVNLHGSFLILFLLVGAAIIGRAGNRKMVLIVFLGMLLASLLNPRGILEWRDAVQTIASPSNQRFSMEWGPPINQGWQAALFFGWILVFPLLAAFSHSRLSITHWIWFLGFGWMALSGVRYVIWFLAILAVLSAELVAPIVSKYLSHQQGSAHTKLNLSFFALMLFLPLLALPGVRQRWWVDSSPAISANTPVKATQWLAEHPELPGPLWADFAFGSYLIFQLPERPVWIDTRFYPFPPEQWERYIQVSDAGPGWEEILDEEGIQLLMLDLDSQADLVSAVGASQAWCEQYRADLAVIFARSSGAPDCRSQIN